MAAATSIADPCWPRILGHDVLIQPVASPPSSVTSAVSGSPPLVLRTRALAASGWLRREDGRNLGLPAPLRCLVVGAALAGPLAGVKQSREYRRQPAGCQPGIHPAAAVCDRIIGILPRGRGALLPWFVTPVTRARTPRRGRRVVRPVRRGALSGERCWRFPPSSCLATLALATDHPQPAVVIAFTASTLSLAVLFEVGV